MFIDSCTYMWDDIVTVLYIPLILQEKLNMINHASFQLDVIKTGTGLLCLVFNDTGSKNL